MTLYTHRRLATALFAFAALPLSTRAASSQQMKMMAPGRAAEPNRLLTSATATTQVYREKNELVIDVGPIDLPAHTMPEMLPQPAVVGRVIGLDGWIHGYRVEITDAKGDTVPHAVLHHIQITDPNRRELFSNLMLRTGGAGGETEPVTLPPLIGFRVHPADSMIVSVLLHNPTDRAYHGVHVKLRAPYSSSTSWIPTLEVYPFFMTVMPPAGGHSFDLPPGKSEFHWEASPAIAGRVIGMGGHLHKYGVKLQLEDRTAHKVLWTTRPDTNAQGDVIGMPQSVFLWKFGIPLHPDHVYRLTAVYFNPTDSTIVDGGMGTLGGLIHPAAPWPAADRANSDYRFDVKYAWRDTIPPNDLLRRDPMRQP